MVPPDGQTPKRSPAQSNRRKVSGRLLALGGAAVVSVYTVGYVTSQSSIDDLTAQLEMPVPTNVPSGGQAPPPGSTTPVPSVSSPGLVYADGIYAGTGRSRHGDITVEVVIEDGKIKSAAVSDCETRYPCSDVNPLISALLTNQAVPTNTVSGATDSARAYTTAVTSALRKALVGT